MTGTLNVLFEDKFEAVGKRGCEGNEDTGIASYTWFEAGLNYSVNDHVALGIGYRGLGLSSDPANEDCGSQAYTDCKSRFFAKLTLKVKWSDLAK